MSNELEKAIRFFKNMTDDNKIVLDSDFGMKKGESNLLYKNRRKYAELAIKVGVNIQPNQTLLIRTPIECADSVRYAVECAYKNGARNVHVEWSDEQCSLSRYLYAPDEVFDEFPHWVSEQYVHIAKLENHILCVIRQMLFHV